MRNPTISTTLLNHKGEQLADHVQLLVVPDRSEQVEVNGTLYRVKERKFVLTEQFEGSMSYGYKQTCILTLNQVGRKIEAHELNC